MVMQKKALICALYLVINSQYSSDMHANKQLVNSENWTLNNKYWKKSLGLRTS